MITTPPSQTRSLRSFIVAVNRHQRHTVIDFYLYSSKQFLQKFPHMGRDKYHSLSQVQAPGKSGDGASDVSLRVEDDSMPSPTLGTPGHEHSPLLHNSLIDRITGDTQDDPEEDIAMEEDKAKPVFYRAVFTTMPVFMGYSGMIVLQDKLKNRLGIETGTNDAYIFGVAVSFLYLGNLIFRLMHNVLFSWLKPRQRVMISYVSMIIATLTIVIPYFVCDMKHLFFVFVAYLVSGVGIGTFESNLISCLTPLGHETKSWAVVGIPLGFNLISIGSFLLFMVSSDSIALQSGVYFFIGCMNLVGLLVYIKFIPNVEFEGTTTTISLFIEDLKKFRNWLPTVWKHCFALMIDMFSVSIFSAIALYIFDVDEVPMWPRSTTHLPKNAFSMIYYTFSFLGDFTSRRIAYRDHLRNPIFFLVLSIIGAGMILSKTALIAPLGMFCVMFANGSIYAQTTKFVDIHVEKHYNLMALSVWLFIGDVGSFVGAQITQPLRTAVGGVPMPYTPAPLTNGTTAPHSMFLSSGHGSEHRPLILQAMDLLGL